MTTSDSPQHSNRQREIPEASKSLNELMKRRFSGSVRKCSQVPSFTKKIPKKGALKFLLLLTFSPLPFWVGKAQHSTKTFN
jgi:hypothetical protein